ncbi:hypothetical protein [Halomonas sp. C05BenzN]|uniref:hypothetical protein n=1 Tax=Halomonas sp. C05BenzN TaxID=3411041 RepID=UPI003B92D97F
MDWVQQLCEHIRDNSVAPPVQNRRSRLNGWRFRVHGRPVVLLMPCSVPGHEALAAARQRWPGALPEGERPR